MRMPLNDYGLLLPKGAGPKGGPFFGKRRRYPRLPRRSGHLNDRPKRMPPSMDFAKNS